MTTVPRYKHTGVARMFPAAAVDDAQVFLLANRREIHSMWLYDSPDKMRRTMVLFEFDPSDASLPPQTVRNVRLGAPALAQQDKLIHRFAVLPTKP